MRRAHQLLRGRYHWAVLLALGLTAIGSSVGYYCVHLTYRSTGLIQIKAYTPKVLYGLEESGPMPMFDTFLAGQMQMLQSPRVLGMAMTSDAWRSLQRPVDPENRQLFHRSLSVYRAEGSDIIAVTFEDEDLSAPSIAVKAVIEAFQRIFDETDRQRDSQRLQILDERRLSLTNQANSIGRQIADFGDVFGPGGVKFRYQAQANMLQNLAESLRDAEMELADVNERLELLAADMTQESPGPEGDAAVRLAELRLQYEALVERTGQENLAAKNAKSQLAIYELLYGGPVKQVDHIGIIERQIPSLRRRREALKDLLNEAQSEFAATSSERARLVLLEEQQIDISNKVDEVVARIEQLSVESTMNDRILVLSYGELPFEPLNKRQPLQVAIAGGMAGAVLGIGLVMLFGIVNPRLRYVGDLVLREDGIPVLGMLPDLPGQIDRLNEDHTAARCIDQIRILLQLRTDTDTTSTMLVTGGASGVGKTSLTLALGQSYATSGSRVLLVDFDLCGRSLSQLVKVARCKRLGRMLVDKGVITAAQRASATDDLDPNLPLGEQFVQQGVIARSDLDNLLSEQPDTAGGVIDVLFDEPISAYTVRLPETELDILPVGDATGENASRVGRLAVQQLLAQSRSHYDVVLIDSGPLPGSVEASLLAGEVDQVIILTSRGDDVGDIKRCSKSLGTLGASIAGLVYNRAEPQDMEHSTSSSWTGSSYKTPTDTRRKGHTSRGRVGSRSPRNAAVTLNNDRK
jgi:polysaccharide biosynthesis transport protein